jgi:hypothetical protein
MMGLMLLLFEEPLQSTGICFEKQQRFTSRYSSNISCSVSNTAVVVADDN